MRKLIPLMISFAAVVLFLSPIPVKAGSVEEARIDRAAAYFQEIMSSGDHGIPKEVLDSATGIAIIPGIVNSPGFGLGGSIGEGVMVVRQADEKWSNPFFIGLTSSNLGLQTGGETHDTILVFETRRGIDAVRNGKLSLGVDVSIIQGPTGRHAGMPGADVYSYSSSRGIYTGVSLGGGVLRVDSTANTSYYGDRKMGLNSILAGTGKYTPASGIRFNCLMAHFTYAPSSAC